VAVAEADRRQDGAALRWLVVHASPCAPQAAAASGAAPAQAAVRGAAPLQRVAACWWAWAGVAWPPAAALAVPCPAPPGAGGHAPADTHATRPPPPTALPQDTVRERLRSELEAHGPGAAPEGWTGLATTVGAESGTAAELRQAAPAQPPTVAPGWRWRKHSAARSPVWREKPARMAAVALRTGVG
jgi:hypothetical protein